MSNWVSRTFWSTYHDSGVVKAELTKLLGTLGEGERGLNVGSGEGDHGQKVVNLDVDPSTSINCVGNALNLPFADGAFEIVLSQETVEHVPDPFRAVREMARVLRSGGILYLQAPFVIGYHPDPEDYWRF